MPKLEKQFKMMNFSKQKPTHQILLESAATSVEL